MIKSIFISCCILVAISSIIVAVTLLGFTASIIALFGLLVC